MCAAVCSMCCLVRWLLVSGISGSKTADMAAVAPVLFPEMRKRGLADGEMVSLLAGAGAMAETIPPSLVLIAIGSVTGVSIAALFTGGLLPGVVLAIGSLPFGAAACRRRGPARRQARLRPHRLRTLVIALPALVLPALIRFAVIERRCHRHRGLHHRHRLHPACRAC